jgi:hypothetical protein
MIIMASDAAKDYIEDAANMASGLLSDLTAKHGPNTWRLHKSYVVCRSTWFAEMVMKEQKVRTPLGNSRD